MSADPTESTSAALTHELTCGRALTPVRVTITRRTAGEPLEDGKAPHA